MKHLANTPRPRQEVPMTRHRIEDLGRLYERLDQIVDHEAFVYDLEWNFMEAMKDEDKREQHYHVLRSLRDELFELRGIASGDDVLNETTV